MGSFDLTTEDYSLNYDDDDDYNFTTDPSAFFGKELCEASPEQERNITIVQTTAFLVVFVLGVIGNGLVIATFALYRRLRLRCMTDVFLFFLALSDMLLLLTLPLQTVETLIGSWEFGEPMCKLNRGMYAINTYSGLLLLACISIDRYLVVVCTRSMRKRSSGTLFYSVLSALSIAVISIMFSLPDLSFSSVDNVLNSNLSSCDMKVSEVKWKLWAQIAKIAGFCIPCITMIVCYGAIGHVLIHTGGKGWRRQRTLWLMALLVVLFLLFQLPYTVVLLIKISTPTPTLCSDWTTLHIMEIVTRNLAYVRCCLNPLLYALVGVRFRNDIIRLLTDAGCVCKCVSQKAPHLGNGSSITPSSPAPTTLTHIPSTYQPGKNTSAPDTPAANTAQTFFFPTPVSGKVTSVISWCHQII
ncbi:C-C chemokine receptor type 10 [Danio rerio]|nr:C-C chemokine receptor type 10 [Danio rerio]AAH76543.1 Zgc:91924 [Danio rerio]|eukprot:NP_001002675.1 chemokine (C-C motif) receptor 10 [Danio rerio]